MTIGSPVCAFASASRCRPSCPSPWKRVRRRARLVRAAAEHRRAGGGDGVRRGQRLVARLDGAGAGDHREVIAAHKSSVYLDDRSFAMTKLRRGELVRAQDRDDLLDALVALEAEPLHVLAVADRADHGDLLAARRVSAGAAALDAGDDGLDVLLGGRRLHDDHHLRAPGDQLAKKGTASGVSGARPLGPLCGRRRQSPAERLAKSPAGIRVGRQRGGVDGGRHEPGELTGARSALPGSARSRPACRP